MGKFRPRSASIALIAAALWLAPACSRAWAAESDSYARGRELVEQGKYSQAKDLMNAAIKANPQDAGAYSARARAEIFLHDKDNAIGDSNKAIELAPQNVTFYQTRAMVYGQLGQLDKALDDATKAVTLAPNDPYSLDYRASVLALREKYPEALADVDKAIKLFPKYTGAYSDRAFIYNHLQKYDKALEDANRAISLGEEAKNPYYAAYGNRARAYFGLSKYSEALSDADIIIKHYPSNTRGYSLRADIYRKLGKADLAKLDDSQVERLNRDPKTLWIEKQTFKTR